jgi:hypothetical protein
MYPEELLIEVIKENTIYTNVSISEETDINIIAIPDALLPKIDVGHIGIKIENTADMSANAYDRIQNPQLLITQVKFICKRVDWVEVYNNIQAAVVGFTPYPNDATFGDLNFIEAFPITKAGDRVYWAIHYALQFPRIS